MSGAPTDPFLQLAARAQGPSDKVLESIRLDLENDQKPRRLLSRKQRVALSGTALLLGFSLTALNALIQDPQSLLLAGAAFSLSAAGLILAGAIPSGKSRLGLPMRRYVFAALAIFLFTFLALQADSFMALSAFRHGESATGAMLCAGHALLSGVLASSTLMLLWRRSDPFSPGLSGAFLGLLGGALGTVSVGLLCHNSEGLHLTLGHGGSALVLALAGAWIGRKWLSP